ncbi:MAG: hypothetical protein IPG06_10595 [Haliea sp.]|nr:hypothetical protein [Haliea sp.]
MRALRLGIPGRRGTDSRRALEHAQLPHVPAAQKGLQDRRQLGCGRAARHRQPRYRRQRRVCARAPHPQYAGGRRWQEIHAQAAAVPIAIHAGVLARGLHADAGRAGRRVGKIRQRREDQAGRRHHDARRPDAKRLAAEVDAAIASMKGTLFQNFDHLMACARAGEVTKELDRARFRFNTAVVADQCVALSSRMLKSAGSSGIRHGSALLKQHHDILASQAHIANIADPFAINLGGMLFGQASIDPSV